MKSKKPLKTPSQQQYMKSIFTRWDSYLIFAILMILFGDIKGLISFNIKGDPISFITKIAITFVMNFIFTAIIVMMLDVIKNAMIQARKRKQEEKEKRLGITPILHTTSKTYSPEESQRIHQAMLKDYKPTFEAFQEGVLENMKRISSIEIMRCEHEFAPLKRLFKKTELYCIHCGERK